ncbi:MAG: hypothetical protein HN509_01240 [Halobacteriovoraceae bacterium]|jgi:hypothetical protein|nr:hypothetical protein [Halobacteriovoraceae bacterium]
MKIGFFLLLLLGQACSSGPVYEANLSPVRIKQILFVNMDSFQECARYQPRKVQNYRLHFTLDSDAAVTKMKVFSKSKVVQKVRTCIRQALGRINFQFSLGRGGDVKVVQPMRLTR